MARTKQRARRSSHLYLPGAFDLFQPSRDSVLNNIWIFGPLYAIPLLFYIHNWIYSPTSFQRYPWWQHSDGFSAGWPGGPLPTFITFAVVGFSILWLLITIAVGAITQIMSQAAQLDAAQHRKLDFSILWRVVREIGWRMLGLYLVMFAVILVGFILLVIPGLIMIRRYLLAPYVMLDERVGIREALDKSAELSKLNTGSVWGVIGVLFLIGLLNIIPLVGGLLAFGLGALYSVAPALRYQQLKQLASR
jgi:hypothetical protein